MVYTLWQYASNMMHVFIRLLVYRSFRFTVCTKVTPLHLGSAQSGRRVWCDGMAQGLCLRGELVG